jgi:hypothetical protein
VARPYFTYIFDIAGNTRAHSRRQRGARALIFQPATDLAYTQFRYWMEGGSQGSFRLGVWGTVRCLYKWVHSRAMRVMAARLRSTSGSVVAQDETLMRIAVLPCQTVPPHQQVPSS